MKKKRWIILIIALFVAGVGLTLAFLNDSDYATNKFDAGYVNVAVVENGDEGTFYEDGTGAQGEGLTLPLVEGTAAKTVQVANKDTYDDGSPLNTVDTYVRVKLVPVLKNDLDEIVPTDINGAIVYENLDLTNWQKIGDYYYYKTVLNAGELTTPLFTGVTYTNSLGANEHLEMNVMVEGIAANQTDGTQSSPQAVWGVSL